MHLFKRVLLACSVRTGLFMRSDGCGILLTDAGSSLITCPKRWTPHKMIRMEYCSSGLHPQKSCSNHGQTHRGNAIVETPCQSPAEFAILLPNSSTAFTSDLTLPFSAQGELLLTKPRHWVHTSPEFILNASFQKGSSSMQRENCSLHEV